MSVYEISIVIGMALWIVIALAILGGLLHAIGLLKRLREPLTRISGAVDDVRERLAPVLANVETASEEASRIAGRLRHDADDVGRSLRRASESTERMVELVEDRVAEVAALLEVVQEEAEETFLSTASVLRGLRRGKKKVSRARRVTRAIGNLGR